MGLTYFSWRKLSDKMRQNPASCNRPFQQVRSKPALEREAPAPRVQGIQGPQTGLQVPVQAPVGNSSKTNPSLSWPDQNLLDDSPRRQVDRQQGALGHVLRTQHFRPRLGAGRR